MTRIEMKLFTANLIFGLLFLMVGLSFAVEPPYRYVKVEGRELKVDFDKNGIYETFTVKSVGYNPMPVGRHPSDWGSSNGRPANILDDEAILSRDFTLLQAMHANNIRIWKGNDTQDGFRYPIKLTTKTLEYASQHNLKVIPGFWVAPFGGTVCSGASTQYITYEYKPGLAFDLTNPVVRNDILGKFADYVNAFKNRPEILFWAIGNENNYSLNLNNPAQVQAWYSLVNDMGQKVRDIEGSAYHPVAVVNGDTQFIGDPTFGASDAQLPNIDIWGANTYRGKSFADYFIGYKAKSTKPFWVSEFGIDAWHTKNLAQPDEGLEKEHKQARWDINQWKEIAGNGDIVIGGTVMEYSDEWWKPYEWLCNDPFQCNTTQNHFGFGPVDTSCPREGSIDFTPAFPDKFANEEWFGLMRISPNATTGSVDIMTPRLAYDGLRFYFDPARNILLSSYLILPSREAVLKSTSATFAWSLGRGVSEHWLLVGTVRGAGNIYSASQGNGTSKIINNLPNNGKPLFVRVKSKIKGRWGARDYRFSTDDVPPMGSIVINQNALKTTFPVVLLRLSATDAGSGMGWRSAMQLTDNCQGADSAHLTCQWRRVEPYRPLKTWLLTPGTGLKTVYVKYMDEDGNWSPVYSDSIMRE